MFRKIHSNRDPGDTLVSEIRKEFGRYFNAAADISKKLLEKRPRLTFAFMVTLMLTSLAVSFIWFRHTEKPKARIQPASVSPMQDGFSAILLAGEKLKKTIQLKKVVDSLTGKKTLSAKDSLALDSALDRLQSIQKNN